MNEIQRLIENFVTTLMDHMRKEVHDELIASLSGKPGTRTIHTSVSASAGGSVVKRARRKGPIQLCPVPNCKNPAAPVFGMVCANHKTLPKATIKKFREARRAAKDGHKGGKVIPIRAGMKKAKRAKKTAVKKTVAKKTVAKKAKKTVAKKAKKTPVERFPAAA